MQGLNPFGENGLWIFMDSGRLAPLLLLCRASQALE